MNGTTRILVIGGTGHFGARICRRLAIHPAIEIFVSSRDKARADALAQEIQIANRAAVISGIALDHNSAEFGRDIRNLAPFVVIHAAGPYQGQDYRVAKACIAAGSHYIDLADARHFVDNFKSLNDAAQRSGVLLVAGASTLPGISTAVIDALRIKLKKTTGIQISIAPAHQTPRGRGTVAAVLSYCGQPFTTLKDGNWRTIYGWQDMRVQKHPTLGRRLSAACNVPDLSLLPEYIPGVKDISFHAALEAPWEQISLWIMAWLTRLHIVSDWTNHVSLFLAISNKLLPFGSVTGGMHIGLTGESADGKPTTYDWYLTAGDNHGPEIPCTPAIVLVKKLLRNELDQCGAYACHAFFSLDEIMDELSEYSITSEILANEDG